MIIAVLDADVLYPLPLRDTLLSAAAAGCFQPRWTSTIVEEAIRNLVADGRLTSAKAEILHKVLSEVFEDAWVEGYESLIATMSNHPKDRHVAACAVQAGAPVIVTSNLKDFDKLPEGLEAVHPDDFLCRLLANNPELLAAAIAEQVKRLKNPPMTVGDLIASYAAIAPKFVQAWRARFQSPV